MKISYVTDYNAADIRNWSGLGFYIAKTLSNQGNEIDYIGDLSHRAEMLYKAKKLLYRAVGKNYLWNREPAILKSLSRQATRKVREDSDIIFSPGTLPVAFMNSRKPKVIYTDAVFAEMIDYYSFCTNLCSSTIRNGNLVEQHALDSCSLAVFSSEWAAQSAIKHYNTPAHKVKVVPFGANIECNRTTEDIKAIIKSKSSAKCVLLFLAVEWKRKGGDKVMEVARLLNEGGLETEVHIAGIRNLPMETVPPYVINHGFISKSTDEGKRKLDSLFEQSHFLILPSEADCTPVVFSEANSYGLPVISTKTGGIPSIVLDNINGHTFSLEDSPEKFANWIEDLFADRMSYEQLALESFNTYNNRLSWKAAGNNLQQLLLSL